MIDPIWSWSSLYAHTGCQITAHQFASTDRLADFVKAGWLVPVGDSEAVPCEVCDEPHLANVELIDQEVKGVCGRIGEAFSVTRCRSLHLVDGDAFALSPARALELDGPTRKLRGVESVWTLGARRLNETRIAFFSTPALGRIDAATTILGAIADQSRSTPHCLLVADDIDAVQLIHRKGVVVRLRDIATIEPAGSLIINSAQLLVTIFPDINKPRRRGRPAGQRERILQLLDESANSESLIDGTNESVREWGLKYKKRFKNTCPAPNTIRTAISIWNARRGIGSSSR